MTLIKQGEDLFFGDKRILLVHLEYTSVCNRRCSYCIEGMQNRQEYSSEKNILGAINKVFNIANNNDFICFIIAGGEPTLQPSLKKVLDKIKSRKNTSSIITTNLTQSVNYYRELDTPIVTSLHFEKNDPVEFLEKVKKLTHLTAHVRIMAHPDLMNSVFKTYNNFKKASATHPISFAIEKLFEYGDFIPEYKQKDLDKISKLPPVDCVYPEYLTKKLGLASNLFYRFSWWNNNEGKIENINQGPNDFRGFFCERNLLVIQQDGKMELSWCKKLNINIFEIEKLPKDIFSTVICHNKCCPMGFASLLPKFKKMKDAPNYSKKGRLLKLKVKEVIKKNKKKTN